MSIRANGDDLPAQLAVTLQYVDLRVQLLKPIAIPRSVDFDAFAGINQCFEYLIDYIRIITVMQLFYRVNALAHDKFQVAVYIEIIQLLYALQLVDEIALISLARALALKKGPGIKVEIIRHMS